MFISLYQSKSHITIELKFAVLKENLHLE